MIFGKRSKNSTNEGSESSEDSKVETPARYQKPKIYLLDVEIAAYKKLQALGFNVTRASFGRPYKTKAKDSLVPVDANGNLTGISEQDIFIIDLNDIHITEAPKEQDIILNKSYWWASTISGQLDPRPLGMHWAKQYIDRAISNGGILIVFSSEKQFNQYRWGKYNGRIFDDNGAQGLSNYSFSDYLVLQNFIEFSHDFGSEMSVIEESFTISALIKKHLDGATFSTTIKPGFQNRDRWLPLVKNKFGAIVSGVFTTVGGSDEKAGTILIVPNLKNKSDFLASLVTEILPGLSPSLFPDLERADWTTREQYQLPRVLELADEIRQVKEEANKRVSILEAQISQEKLDNKYLFDILTMTGDDLVDAVEACLRTIGFESVVNVDKKMESEGLSLPRREDLQIDATGAPLVLVEVKGINGTPKDAAALQVYKYIIPRIRETGMTDIRGLCIINHQRNLPPLDRDNQNLFREEILANAEEQGFGLISTWDLHKIVRSFIQCGWRHENVRPIFYRNGRIDPIPENYEFIGQLENIWERNSAIGVRLESSELRRGERIAIETPTQYLELRVDSLQVENVAVDVADAGKLAGIASVLKKGAIKKGMKVYKAKY